MRYLHVLSAFAAEPWAMQPEKLEAVASFLLFKARGGSYSAEDLEARFGGNAPGNGQRSTGTIALLPMYGVVSQRAGMLQEISGGTSTEALAGQFRNAVADEAVTAIVFDVDSPGGGTYGVDELASEIRAARGVKPIIAQVNSLCASAAYYLASQADEVVITPGGEVGSIGVYAVHEDISKMLESEGVKPTLIRGQKGVNKAETASHLPLSASARSYLQDRVNLAEDAFITAVAAGRRTTVANVVDNFGKGRMFGAKEAVQRGLADQVGTLHQTLERLGVQGPRYNASADSRRAFATGQNPSLSQIEDVLRDAGFPKALAANFVSAGKGALRSESGPDETRSLSPDAQASLAAFLARIQN